MFAHTVQRLQIYVVSILHVMLLLLGTFVNLLNFRQRGTKWQDAWHTASGSLTSNDMVC